MKRIFFILVLSGQFFALSAQEFNKEKVVDRLADLMNRNYVFPDKGKAMHDLIKGKQSRNEYEQYASATDFAKALEADLRSVINDKHIRFTYNKERAEAIRKGGNRSRDAEGKFGFEEVEILDGNIGYLDLRGFSDIGPAEEVAKPVMDKLISADAIIFDLRKNGGGSPSMIRFISSYLFGQEPVHLNTFYWRPSDSYTETWTDPNLASQTKPDIPIYVLTSHYTFSAAEEFTYNLKHLERATIIGETTGGGAHPGGPAVVAKTFIINIPRGKAINPITKTNWEGVGVVPNIKADKSEALVIAIELARKAIGTKN